MENFFKLKENNTNIKKELVAGLTTFLTMAYIIAVNAGILSDGTGMPMGALVTATCLAAAVASIFMGLYAKMPLGVASGMGLNAYFTYAVIHGMKMPWQAALAAIFVQGVIFIILSMTKIRDAVFNAIPLNLKLAITSGIGLFIAFIGFVNSGIVIQDKATLVKIGEFTSPTVLIAIVGVLIIVVLSKNNVKGALLWGIVGSTIVAWSIALISPETATAHGIILPNSNIFKYESIAPIAGKFDFSYISGSTSNLFNFITVVLTFLFVSCFDTVGTVVGVSSKANLLDESGNVKGAGKALVADAVGTTFGALVGVSPQVAFVESTAGVLAGGRTGLTAITTGLLFLIAMFFSPLFIAVPASATAPALIIVGYFMIEQITNIDFSDFTEGVPAFLTIAAMPLTYSIGDGLSIGIASYFVINVLNNIFGKDKTQKKKLSPFLCLLAIVFIIKLVIG